MSFGFLSHVFQLPTVNASTRGFQPEARGDVNYALNIAPKFSRLVMSLIVILALAAR